MRTSGRSCSIFGDARDPLGAEFKKDETESKEDRARGTVDPNSEFHTRKAQV